MVSSTSNFFKPTLAEVLERVGKHTKEGEWFKALCPVHGDKNPSLGVKQGTDGKAYIECFSQHCEYKDILEALGFPMFADENNFCSNKTTSKSNKSKTNVKTEATPQTKPNPSSSKRIYDNLAEYAQFKGVSEQVFLDAGWENWDWHGKKAIRFKTANGYRYRLLTETHNCFRSDKGFKNCWYGLTKAKTERTPPLIWCNGEPSTVLGQHYQLAAFCFSGGENTDIPHDKIEELKAVCSLDELLLIALDADETGKSGAIKKLEQLQNAGFTNVRALDFGSDKPRGFDLADFIKIYKENSLEELLKLSNLIIITESPDTDEQTGHAPIEGGNDANQTEVDSDDDEYEAINYTPSDGVKNKHGYYIRIGEVVRASDRDNFGEVKGVNGQFATVYFYNKETGKSATVNKDIDELTPTNPSRSKDVSSTQTPVNFPTAVGQAAYHGVLGEIIRTIAPHSESNPESILLTIIMMMGNIIGRRCYFEVARTRHYPILNIAVVGSTGCGKGSSLAEAEAFINPIDSEWSKNCVASGLSSGEGLVYRVRDKVVEQVEIKDKETKEKKLVEREKDPGVTDKRLFVQETELSNMLQVMKREGSNLSSIIRNAYDSRTLETMSKHDPMKATNPHVSILGHITKEELKALFSQNDKNNGFANRIAFVAAKRDRYLVNGSKIPVEPLNLLRDKVKKAIEFLDRKNSKLHNDLSTFLYNVENGIDGVETNLDQSAIDLLDQYYVELCDNGSGQIANILNRARVIVRRVAMIYTVLDCSLITR
ncbi:MAG: hypothetical protein FD167_194, partial [bacterium]